MTQIRVRMWLAAFAACFALHFTVGCLSEPGPDEVGLDEEAVSGCPFVTSNLKEWGARHWGWPPDAQAADCHLVANACELGSGSVFLCWNATTNGGNYSRIFIPRQIASCSMQAYTWGCDNAGCRVGQTHYQCSGYNTDYNSSCSIL